MKVTIAPASNATRPGATTSRVVVLSSGRVSDISHIRRPQDRGYWASRKRGHVRARASLRIQGINDETRDCRLGLGLLALAGPAAAESPVAVVEDVQGKVTGAEFMDYVIAEDRDQDRRRRLRRDQLHEILPAREDQRARHRHHRHRRKLRAIRRRQAREDRLRFQRSRMRRRRRPARPPPPCCAASTTTRTAPKIKTQLTLYGASPMVEAKGKGTLVVERLDVKGERQQIELTGSQRQGQVLRLCQRQPRADARRHLCGDVRRHRRSCSRSIRRPSPVRRRSSAA